MTTRTSKFVTAKKLPALAKKPGRHPVENAKGLFLTAKTNGLAYWTYRYRLAGRETETSLGAASEMGLDQAKAAHAEKRAMVLKGIDPRGDKHPLRHPTSRRGDAPTFAEAAEKLIAERQDEWRSAKHHHQWVASLNSLPEAFKSMRADRITPEDVRDVLRPLWKKTPVTARRIRARIEKVIGSTRGSADSRSNPAALSDWLKNQLGESRVNRDPVTGHRASHPAILFAQVPALMARLEERGDQASKALQFLILAGARTREILDMTWGEIDLTHDMTGAGAIAPMLVLPATRMKAYRRHRVPLSPTMLAILETQAAARGMTIEDLVEIAETSDSKLYVFPGTRPGRPMAQASLALALKRAEGQGTVHGLRSAFRSFATSIKTPFEIAEDAIAHAAGDGTVQSYFRPDSPHLRLELTAAWSRFCVSSPALPMLPAPEMEAA
jgi:integrase